MAAEVEHAAARAQMTVADFTRQALQAALDGYPDSLDPGTHQWLTRQARTSQLADAREAQRRVLAEVVRRYPRGVHLPG